MNRLQLTGLMNLVFITLDKIDNRQHENKKLKAEWTTFHDKHIKNLAKKDEPEDWGLSAKDRATLDKMEAKFKDTDPSALIKEFIHEGENLIKDPKLYESKHEVKSAYSPSELSEAINKLEDQYEIVGLKYFTGTNEGDLVYCCGIKYLKAKKGK